MLSTGRAVVVQVCPCASAESWHCQQYPAAWPGVSLGSGHKGGLAEMLPPALHWCFPNKSQPSVCNTSVPKLVVS